MTYLSDRQNTCIVTMENGRFLITENNNCFTTLRGFCLEVLTETGVSLSSESDSVQTGDERNVSISSTLRSVPVDIVFQPRTGDQTSGINVLIKVRKRLKIRSITLSGQIRPDYDILSLGNVKQIVSPGPEEIIWCGFPQNRRLTFECSREPARAVSFHLKKNSRLKEVRVRRSNKSCGPAQLEFVRFQADKDFLTIEPGLYPFLNLEFQSKPEMPEPIYYPKELFLQGPLRSILIVSDLDRKQTLLLASRLKNVMPVHWSGSEIKPPDFTVSWEKSDGLPLKGLIEIAPVRSVSDLMRLIMKSTKPGKYDLIVRFQYNLHASFGYRFNILARHFRTEYKAKLDITGRSSFFRNSTSNTVSRVLIRLRTRYQQLMMRTLKLGLLLCLLPFVPFVVLAEKRRARSCQEI